MDRIKERYAIGVDLGGTFVKYALVSRSGTIIYSGENALGGDALRNNILDVISNSIKETVDKADEQSLKIEGIGIGSPGIIDNGVVLGGAENLNGWENIDLATIFGEKFKLPVFADNDANVMGLGEVTFGAAKNCTDALFITVGTGIGGAVIIDEKLYGGYKNRGGELGHITIKYDGIDCNCGGRGCLEAYASTSALVRNYVTKSGSDPKYVDGKHIIQKYKEGDLIATKCLEEHVNYLGHGIAGFVNIFAPQKVVIGGGISEAGQFYIDMIKESVFKYAMVECSVNTQVVPASLGNRAGCLGAASLVFSSIVKEL